MLMMFKNSINCWQGLETCKINTLFLLNARVRLPFKCSSVLRQNIFKSQWTVYAKHSFVESIQLHICLLTILTRCSAKFIV